MLRDDRKEPMPMPRPVPIPRREPTYEMPSRDDFDYPKYDCPDFRYPMMPMYPNNMHPCPYPYSERDMYGDRRIDLEEMMRRNPMLKRCVMECIERYGQSSNPCNPCRPCRPCRPHSPSPMPRKPMRRPCYGLEEYDGYDDYESYDSYNSVLDESEIYEFSDAELENFIDISESEKEITE